MNAIRNLASLFVAVLVCLTFAWKPADQVPTEDASTVVIPEPDSTAQYIAHDAHAIDLLVAHPYRLPVLPPEWIDKETLWLARGIFSESKQPHEQTLVAWVIRNRVETQYRNKNTYQSVVLDPYQFSAFNRNNHKRSFYMTLNEHSTVPGWQRTLSIAYHVRRASAAHRPFSESVRHFYSERSLQDGAMPEWAIGLRPVNPSTSFVIDARRFRFFADVV